MNPENEILVKVDNVSKKFCRSLKKSLWYGVCDIFGELNPFAKNIAGDSRSKIEGASGTGDRSSEIEDRDQSPAASGGPQSPISHLPSSSPRASDEDLRPDEFYAVRDVSFELRRGECLGLIGHNGAGKTTLLKMLNGLIKPDTGSITMRGRVGALIALGAGFNPILTGRENIYVNGSVLGFSTKEIDARVEDIIAFAEIGDFIDMPVRHYSSGMTVRLGFSVASSMEPDVLILDEVLAVGDIGFVIKCMNRVRRLAANAAVIFVSHNMPFVSSFCSRIIFMDHGRALLDTTEIADAIDRYYEMIKHEINRSGSGGVDLLKIRLKNDNRLCDSDIPKVEQGSSSSLLLQFEVSDVVKEVVLVVSILDDAMAPLLTIPVVLDNGSRQQFSSGKHSIEIPLGKMEMNAGKYSFMVAFVDPIEMNILNRIQGLHPFRVYAVKTGWGRFIRPTIAKIDCAQDIP